MARKVGDYMWVEQRGEKYLAVDRYKDYMTGKWKRVSVSMDRDTPQARNKAKAILQSKIDAFRQLDPEPVSVTIKQLKEDYIDYQRKIYKESTVHRNENVLNIVTGIIGLDTLCARLSAGSIMRALLDTNKPNVTINSYITRLKAMLRWGYQNDYCPEVAGKLKKLPDLSERLKIQDKFLERDELKALLEGLNEEHWKNLTEFLALSGLRIGEAQALRYSDINIKERLIHVTRTFSQVVKGVTTPKSPDSVRDVYIQDELLPLCRKLLSGAKRKALEFGYQSNLVFANDEGGFIDYDAYNKYLRENGIRILNRHITTHAMRHTMTSLFAEAGVSLEVISRRLGHHDSKITKDIYYHVTKIQREKDNEAVRQISIL